MKKFFAMMLALAMMLSMVACGGTTAEPTTEATEPALTLAGTMEELVNQVVTEQPVEFMGGIIPVDLTDTSEDGLWAIKSYTGLDSAENITDVAVFEPMMGSIGFSLVMVRTTSDAAKSVAESMKAGIDQRKWICVEADDLKVAGFGDVVMLIMVDSTNGMTSQSFVDAFGKVIAAQFEGVEPEFVLE